MKNTPYHFTDLSILLGLIRGAVSNKSFSQNQ